MHKNKIIDFKSFKIKIYMYKEQKGKHLSEVHFTC